MLWESTGLAHGKVLHIDYIVRSGRVKWFCCYVYSLLDMRGHIIIHNQCPISFVFKKKRLLMIYLPWLDHYVVRYWTYVTLPHVIIGTQYLLYWCGLVVWTSTIAKSNPLAFITQSILVMSSDFTEVSVILSWTRGNSIDDYAMA